MNGSTSGKTTCDSARAEPRRPGRLRAAVWRPAGLLYLAAMLAGLAAGLWPEAIVPRSRQLAAAPLPTLQTLAVAQVAFILLIHPLVILHRSSRGPITSYWPQTVVESAGMLLVTAPLYVAAAFLADAVAADVIRTALYVLCLWTVSWAAGKHLAFRHRGHWAILLVLWVLALGGPAAYYIARELLTTPARATWLWHLSPATFAWQTAQARQGGYLPTPIWPALIWPGLAAIAVGCDALLPKPAKESAFS